MTANADNQPSIARAIHFFKNIQAPIGKSRAEQYWG